MAFRQPTHRTSFLGSHPTGGRFGFGVPLNGRTNARLIVSALVLLAAWFQVAPDATTRCASNHESRKSGDPVTTQLTAVTRAFDSNQALPPVFARVGFPDSFGLEPSQVLPGILASGQTRTYDHGRRELLALNVCNPSSHRTLVNLNVRMQI